MSRRPTHRVLVVGPAAFRPALTSALAALSVEVARWSRARTGLEQLAERARGEADAIVVIASPRRSPRALVRAPLVGGLPVGIVLAESVAALTPWLQALTPQAPRASGGERLWAVLAEWEERYLRRARAFAARLAQAAPRRRRVRRWLADRLNREALLERLDRAPRWVNYFGHASHEGLAGYFGITAADLLARPASAPLSVFWCWACRTLHHARARAAFGTRLVSAGRVAAFVGSVHAVKTDANETLAGLAAGLMARAPATVGELIRDLDEAVTARGDAALARTWRSYRLLGNPFEAL